MLHHLLRRLRSSADEAARQKTIVVWGSSGTGKSMFLHALADYWTQIRPAHRTVTIHAADWARGCDLAVDERIHSDHDLDPCRSAHAAISSTVMTWDQPISTALFLDDVHQLVGRPAAQLRLAQAMDDISQAGGIVFLTCRSHPAATSGLLAKLVSRLMGGVLMEIHAPGLQARAVIVKKFAERAGWLLSTEAAALAAERFDGSVRELRQALSRCLPVRPLCKHEIGAAELASRFDARSREAISPQDIMKIVARHYGVSVETLKSPSRRRNIVLARSVAMYLSRKITNFPLIRIGRAFGGRDHTTVIHACRKIEQQIGHDTELNRFLQETTTKLRLQNSSSIAED